MGRAFQRSPQQTLSPPPAPDFQEISEFDQFEINIGPNEMSEVQAVIKRLENNKAAGDQVTSEMRKAVDSNIVTELSNEVWGRDFLPDQRKTWNYCQNMSKGRFH